MSLDTADMYLLLRLCTTCWYQTTATGWELALQLTSHQVCFTSNSGQLTDSCTVLCMVLNMRLQQVSLAGNSGSLIRCLLVTFGGAPNFNVAHSSDGAYLGPFRGGYRWSYKKWYYHTFGCEISSFQMKQKMCFVFPLKLLSVSRSVAAINNRSCYSPLCGSLRG